MRKMSFLLPLLFLVFALISSVYIQEPETYILSDDLTLYELEKNIWQVDHRFPWSANSLLLKLDERDLVLVDTPQDESGTRTLIKWIDAQFGKECRITVINTHFHSDCLAGNHLLLKRGCTVMGMDRTAALLASYGEAARKRTLDYLAGISGEQDVQRYIKGYSETVYDPPNLTFELDSPVTLYIANQPVELFFPGPGHSMDNIVVYFNRQRLLFGGCLVKDMNARGLGSYADGDLAQWPESVRKVEARYKAAKWVIPGHGEPGDRQLLLHTLELLNSQGTQ